MFLVQTEEVSLEGSLAENFWLSGRNFMCVNQARDHMNTKFPNQILWQPIQYPEIKKEKKKTLPDEGLGNG